MPYSPADIAPPAAQLSEMSHDALAQDLLATMWDGYAIDPQRVFVQIQAQHVQLSGEVDWKYQLQGAVRCALALPGIRSVNNLLTLTPDPVWHDLQTRPQHLQTGA